MSAISNVVDVTISRDTLAVPQESFGTPLIVGPSNRFTGAVKAFSKPKDMIEAGYSATDPEYVRAVKMFSQKASPTVFYVAKYVTGTGNAIVNGIRAAQDADDKFYGITICSQTAADILEVAAYIETQKKIFIADTVDADILTDGTNDVASTLKALGYNRTALLYSKTPNDGKAAAWLGGQLPATPGSNSWKFKELVGCLPDTFRADERLRCVGRPGVPGKNCNIYEVVGGSGITQEGLMSGGEFIDVMIGIDWLESTMERNVFTLVRGPAKLPYTDQGIAVVLNAVNQTIQQGVGAGLVDGASPIVTNSLPVAEIPSDDRKNRILTHVTWECRLAGAIHFAAIQGTVTV